MSAWQTFLSAVGLGPANERAKVDVTNPRDPVLGSWFGGRATAAGVTVTVDAAIGLPAVFRCVALLSSAIAALPLELYRRGADDSRTRDINNPLYVLLHSKPNRWQTSFEYREMQGEHVLLRGNAYSQIVRNGAGTAIELIPLHPDRVRPFTAPDKSIAYEYRPADGPPLVFLQHEVHHVRGPGGDQLKGLSPITATKQAIGLTLAAEQFGSEFFGNSTVIGGVLEHPDKLSDKAFENLKHSWEERHRGPGNAHKPTILEEGMKWQSLGVAPEEAQFLETRRFQTTEIARIFGVPPHMLYETDKSTSWGSGIEQQGIGFVTYSLQPWLSRFEQAIERDLFTDLQRKRLMVEFNVTGLLRGDAAGRAAYYASGITNGWMTRNEARRFENMNALDGLDEPLQPLNMVEAGQEPEEEPEPEPEPESDDAVRALHSDQFRRALDKVITCQARALRDKKKSVSFFDDHAAFVERQIDGLAPAGLAADIVEASKRALKANPDLEAWRTGGVDALASEFAARAFKQYKELNDERS